ncbi:MAG: hypothetical protein MJ211_11210 [Bacteroidales bacterium]|nr:hypothetical protein [Bacteroidales bacterium]
MLQKIKDNNFSSYMGIIGCVVAIALVIVAGSYFSYLLPSGAVIISSLMSIVFTALAFKPFRKIFEKELAEQQKIQADKDTQIEKANNIISEKDSIIKELEDKINTRNQNLLADNRIEAVSNLELYVTSQQGYLVKKALISDLENRYGDEYKTNKGLLKDLIHKDRKDTREVMVLFKYYHKASIGIDLRKVRFCKNGDKIALYNVNFYVIHKDLSSEIEKDKLDVEFCETLNNNKGKLEIVNDSICDKIKTKYCEEQKLQVKKDFNNDIENQCKEFTKLLQSNIKTKFPQVEFVDSIEKESLSFNNVNYISTTQDYDVLNITSLIADYVTSTSFSRSCASLSA